MIFKRSSLLLMLAVALALPASAVDSSTVGPANPQQAAHPTLLAQRLGLSTQDLKAKMPAAPYQANPVAESGPAVAGMPLLTLTDNIIGTMAVDNYQGMWPNTRYMCSNADGFRNYLAKWYRPNFANTNEDVWNCQYQDRPDVCSEDFVLGSPDGTDTGIDSVLCCFHSGSGGMVNSSVYAPCMGSDSGDLWWAAPSDRMTLGCNWWSRWWFYNLGDQRLRYMFWYSPQSMQSDAYSNPWNTWEWQAGGIRMIFGFNSASIPDVSYFGKYFWEEWNKNKKLYRSWLDASIRITNFPTFQPCVMAFGYDSTEAMNILWGERYLYYNAVAPEFSWWTWYSKPNYPCGYGENGIMAHPSPFAQMDAAALASAHPVLPRGNSNEETMALGKAIGLQIDDPGFIEERPYGLRAVHAAGATLFVEANGNFELSLLKTPALADRLETMNITPLSEEAMIEKARAIVSALRLPGTEGLKLGHIRDLNANDSGTSKDRPGSARIVERTVVFDQMVEGLPFVDPEAGHLEITFDAQTGQPTYLRCTLREVGSVTTLKNSAGRSPTIESLRAEAIKTMPTVAIESIPADETMPTVVRLDTPAAAWEVIPETESIGYRMIDGQAVPVYQAAVRDSRFPTNRVLQQVIVPLAGR